MSSKAPTILLTGSSTKNAVIAILSQNPGLSLQQAYHQVTKETRKPISYQALHKALKELENEKIVEKQENKYRLNLF